MRFVDTSSLVISHDWLVSAKIQLGNTHLSLWSYLKPEFEKILPKKCWFSESVNSGSDNVIEHFRPKANQVMRLTDSNADLEEIVWNSIDSSSREGYKFLEFVNSNYRYACTFVNSLRSGQNGKSRGKSNFFPLKLNSTYGNCIDNINNEQYCLLDPCAENDPSYLTFNELGEVQPHVSVSYTSWEYCRVQVSIEVYHLHYYRFRDDRLKIWDSCKQNIELAHQLQASLKTEGEIKSFKFHISEIIGKINIRSAYSAVAIDCINYYLEQDEYKWLEKFFSQNNLKK